MFGHIQYFTLVDTTPVAVVRLLELQDSYFQNVLNVIPVNIYKVIPVHSIKVALYLYR